MSLSLNEVSALAKKSARGAGYSWGLSEETGRAIRWLCSRNVDGCAALADLLARSDGVDLSGWSPQSGDIWQASAGMLCPVITGATLSDHADQIALANLPLAQIAQPILLAPFAAMAAAHLNRPVRLTWDGGRMETDGRDLRATALPGEVAAGLQVSLAPVPQGNAARSDLPAPTGTSTRGYPSPAVLAVLNAFAHRTYAPATEHSRLSGAGAGLSDND